MYTNMYVIVSFSRLLFYFHHRWRSLKYYVDFLFKRSGVIRIVANFIKSINTFFYVQDFMGDDKLKKTFYIL
jgi:hypothetical protein